MTEILHLFIFVGSTERLLSYSKCAGSYQYAMDVVAIQVSGRSLQEPPLPAFIVGHVGLDLVVSPLVSNQHAFNSCDLTDTHTHTTG